MSPHYNVLPEAVCCCLQTCNYDQSLVVTDTNTLTSFVMGVQREKEEEEHEQF